MVPPQGENPWCSCSDTAPLVFSSTKGLTAACVLRLVERGVLDLAAPVAAYWPEFAAEGKAHIPLTWVLCHRAGVPVVDAPLTLEQVLAWDPVIAAIAAQAPVWEPGTQHGYHFRTYGWILARSSVASPAERSARSSRTRWRRRSAWTSGSASRSRRNRAWRRSCRPRRCRRVSRA